MIPSQPAAPGTRASYRSAALALLGALALAGCQDKPGDGPTSAASGMASESPAAEAIGPDARPGITAAQGRFVLPVVVGRPGAAYFTVHNNAESTATLVAVHIEGVGKAQMHRTEGGAMTGVDNLDIAPGTSVAFEPGGLHVMAFELAKGLARVKTTELTMTFSDGDKVSIPLSVERMGMDMDEDMDGGAMDHAGMSHEGMNH